MHSTKLKKRFFGLFVFLLITRPFSVEAQAAPSINLTINGQKAVSAVAGSQVTFQWSSTKTVGTLTASGGWSGQKSLNGSETITVSGTGAVSYTLTGKNKSGLKTATDSVMVTVVAPPTVTLLANGLAAETVQSGSIVILSWTSSNATSVVASGDWPGIGIKAISGVETVRVLINSTYTLTATGPGGSAVSTATVTVSDQPSTRQVSLYIPYILVGNDPDGTENVFTESTINRMQERKILEFAFFNSEGQALGVHAVAANGATSERQFGFSSITPRGVIETTSSHCTDVRSQQCRQITLKTGYIKYTGIQIQNARGDFLDDMVVQVSVQKRRNGNIISSFDIPAVMPKSNFLMSARLTSKEDLGFAAVNPAGTDGGKSVVDISIFNDSGIFLALTEITIEPGRQIVKFVSDLFPGLSPGVLGNKLTDGSMEIKIVSGPAIALTGLKKEISSDGLVVLTGISTFPGRQQ